jgi:glutathione S-transferase
MLTIYGVPVSVHTRKVILAAQEKHLEFRNEPIIPFQPPTGWAEMSPTGKIPVMTDGNRLLRDSSAICAYLDRVHPEPPLYPLNPAAYADALFFEEYADTTLFPEVVRPLFYQKVIRPQILGQITDTVVVEQVTKDVLPKVFGYLDRETARDFLAGEAFSVADIALMSNLLNFHYLGAQIDTRFAHLRQYFRRHLARPSFQRVLAGEQAAARSLHLDPGSLAA